MKINVQSPISFPETSNVDSCTAELVANLGETWFPPGSRCGGNLAEKDFYFRVQRKERPVEKPVKLGLAWNCKMMAQVGT